MLASVLAVVLAGCTLPTDPTDPGAGARHPSSTAAAGGSAMTALGRLSVKGRAPMTGYDRDRFGPAWLDADRNGCDTRNDVLRAGLTHADIEPGTHGCVVLSGDLADPYTGSTIHFVRGDGTLVDIDHVVALGNAWATGAFHEPILKRAALANDPLNLLPVDASANRQKGDGDAATWLPADKSYRCRYVARQVAVKTKYDLWVTPPEHDAIERVLDGCPGQRLPADSGAPVLVTVHVTDPAEPPPAPTPTPSGPAAGSSPSWPSGAFASCAEARAAGAAPLHRGDPGYSSSLDGDGDGVACE